MGCAQAKQSQPKAHTNKNHAKQHLTNQANISNHPQSPELMKVRETHHENQLQTKENSKFQEKQGNKQNLFPLLDQQHQNDVSLIIQKEKLDSKKSFPKQVKERSFESQKYVAQKKNESNSNINPNNMLIKQIQDEKERRNQVIVSNKGEEQNIMNKSESSKVSKQNSISRKNDRPLQISYQKKNLSLQNMASHIDQQVNYSKRQNSNKKPFIDNTYYQLHQAEAHQNTNQKAMDESRGNNQSVPKKKQFQLEDSYSQENKLANKIMKSQVALDHSNTLMQKQNGPIKNKMFSKKNEFYSVLQQKKGFQDRFEVSNSLHELQIEIGSKQIDVEQINFKQIDAKIQQKQEEFLIQEHDQEGSVRAPLQTSYRAPSKRTIQEFSRKQISGFHQTKSVNKYMMEQQDQAITEMVSMEKQDEGLAQGEYVHSSRQQSKIQTAFFREPSYSKIQSIQKLNINSGIQQKSKMISQIKRAGQISFTEISFKEKQQQDEIPEQGSYFTGLQMSVHLNIAEHY